MSGDTPLSLLPDPCGVPVWVALGSPLSFADVDAMIAATKLPLKLECSEKSAWYTKIFTLSNLAVGASLIKNANNGLLENHKKALLALIKAQNALLWTEACPPVLPASYIDEVIAWMKAGPRVVRGAPSRDPLGIMPALLKCYEDGFGRRARRSSDGPTLRFVEAWDSVMVRQLADKPGLWPERSREALAAAVRRAIPLVRVA
jgi:hypothetical protein